MVSAKTQELENRILAFLKQNLPIRGEHYYLDITGITTTRPSAIDNIDEQIQMKVSGQGDLKGFVRGKVACYNNKTGKVISSSREMNLIPIYYLTDRGTFMSGGVEKSILSQMRLKPGSYTRKTRNRPGSETMMSFDRDQGKYMPQVAINYDPTSDKFEIGVKAGNVKNFNGVGFLRAFGASDQEISAALGSNAISDSLMRSAKNVSISNIYEKIIQKPAPDTPDKAYSELMQYFSENARFGKGQDVVSGTLGISDTYLTKNALLSAVKKTMDVYSDVVEEDDKDDTRFKLVLNSNDLIMEQLEKDFNAMKNDVKRQLDKKEAPNLSVIRPAVKLGAGIDNFIKSGDKLSENPEQHNPLFMASMNNAITQYGEGGLSSNSTYNAIEPRNVKAMSMNRIDPVETPESGKMGLVERLTQGAVVKDGTIYAKFYKVFGKNVSTEKDNEVELSPQQEYESVVAFFDDKYLKRDGNEIVFTKDSVLCRYKGKNGMYPIGKVQYVDRAAQDIFNYSANMIPYVHHDDGARALMGTNMQRQAITIKNREAPNVTTSVNGTSQTYDELIGEMYGKPIRSQADGVVSAITNSTIVVTGDDGKKYVHEFYKYYPLNQAYINNEVIVKTGDRIKKNDLIAEGWQTKDGKLALGLNARVGYLAYDGYNYEDGIVISDSFANRMESEDVTEYSVDIPADAIGGSGSNVKELLKGETTNSFVMNNLDKDGIIKINSKVSPGDILVAYMRPDKLLDDVIQLALGAGKNKKYHYEEHRIPKTSYVNGQIVRINVVPGEGNNKQKIIFTLVSSKGLKLGDKISGKHGNKGTITKIIPDSQMPVAEDGKKLEVLFSPLAVPSRKNPGQLLEVGAGLIAEKTGKRIVVDNFNSSEAAKVKKGLKEIGFPDGKMQVYVPRYDEDGKLVSVPTENKVTVGDMYVMRLNKEVDKNIQARSNLETNPSSKDYMPGKETGKSVGEKFNPQSMGEMEMRALQSNGAVYNILESSTIKADGGGDKRKRVALFRALATGKYDDLDFPATPESLKLTADTMKAFGVKLQPGTLSGNEVESFDELFSTLKAKPIKDSELLKMVGKKNEVVSSRAFKSKEGEDEPEKGGLFDPEIFGEQYSDEARKNWGYIKLSTSIPNPILMDQNTNPYAILTGKNSKEINQLVTGKNVVVSDPSKYQGKDKNLYDFEGNMKKAGFTPGQLVSASDMEAAVDKYGPILWKSGNESLLEMLDGIDLKKEIKETKLALDSAKSTQVDKIYKKYKTLTALEKNKMKPSDLMISYVPVMPTYMRQAIRQGDSYTVGDANKLYMNLIRANNPVKETIEDAPDLMHAFNPIEAVKDASMIYSKVSDLYGQTTAVDPLKHKEIRGISHNLEGKESNLIRDKLLSKRVDFSARSVIGSDPNLGIDEVGVPVDVMKYTYKPFIYKKLIEKGYAKDELEASKKWEITDKDVRKVMDEIAEERPVLINRAPSLHGHSIQAFKPVIKDKQDGSLVRNIQLNSMIVTGLNADFDGDQVALHVPITDRAKEEAKKLMLPTNSLISPTNGKIFVEIRHEMALGIYYLTTDADKPVGEPIRYNSYAKLRKDLFTGKIKTKQNVSYGEFNNTTAGYVLFMSLIPKAFRNENEHPRSSPWSAKSINALLQKMYDSCEETNGSTISKVGIGKVIDDIKSLGFEASTISGISLGINDLNPVKDVDKEYKKQVDIESRKLTDDPFSPQIRGALAVTKEIEDGIANNTIVSKDSPVSIMINSGARGNKTQFGKIIGAIGVGQDVAGNITNPVMKSLSEGLSAAEYMELSRDSRNGMYNRSVATYEPGKETREMWNLAQDMVITEKDCGTKEGIHLSKGNPSLAGRTACENIIGTNGDVIVRSGEMISKSDLQKIIKDNALDQIKVRSPMKCRTAHGICQKCYGSSPGEMRYVKLGTAVGTISSQAFGEPFTQGSLSAFHSGGISNIRSFGLQRVTDILQLSEKFTNKAILANVSGKVSSIEQGMNGTFDTVYVGTTPHRIPHVEGKHQPIKVKVGDYVAKGDFLTVGSAEDLKTDDSTIKNNLTLADPNKMFKLKTQEFGQEEARNQMQDYLSNSIDFAVNNSIGKGKVDRRYTEVLVSKITSKVKISEPSESSYFRGDYADKNEIDDWNYNNASKKNASTVRISDKGNIINKLCADFVKGSNGSILARENELITPMMYESFVNNGVKTLKVMCKPIEYEIKLATQITAPTLGNNNFFSGMAGRDTMGNLRKGIVFGQEDKLDEPRTRLMTGKLLNIGEGFKVPRRIADSISTKMYNLFSKEDK